ncbi:pyrroloquinoline quinone biosynthesis peptide chaperone PqqD [Actinomycetospora soli]|uniref:pyrroloquinoline quinone biosynthesis peptide chaperone PqqD n=1 Tax=Actinomycetospora soli TaxID=2893887 RepID=UPI001E43E4B3|nr:pyrroloquinoline quinone biosynthesis peptide chaperone PqqD [Actinomycetospora soli]MCD2188215.1 pyrroloquinoline quinone biosynthesis peptide chaperone PqqD [Actinomycetospora soli]
MSGDARSGAGPSTLPVPTTGVPRLGRGVKFRYDRARDRHVLLLPETVVELNGSGAAILELCDGVRTVAEIEAALRERYTDVPEGQVVAYLTKLAERRHVEIHD